MYFQNVMWYLEDHTHPKLGAVRHFVHCSCIVYVLCMLVQVPDDTEHDAQYLQH